jgi:hypothetical protein
MLDNLICESGYSIRYIEKKIGISKNQLYDYIRSEGNETIDFVYYLKIIRILKPEFEEEFIKLISLDLKRPQSLRYAMEYTISRYHYDLTEKLICTNESGSRENKNWSQIYRILLSYARNEKELSCIESDLDSFKPFYFETEVLQLISYCYVYYGQKKYNELYCACTKLLALVPKLKGKFIRESYTARLYEMLAKCYLFFKNNVALAREYAEKLLENEYAGKYKIHAFYVLGASYLYEDYIKCISYYEEYIDMLRANGKDEIAERVINQDIPFVNNYCGYLDITLSTDKSEKAHYLIKKGRKEEALELLNSLPLPLTPFQKYYKALATDSPELFSESFIDFITSGDMYYAELPRKKLEKFDVYSYFSNLVYNSIISK